MNSKVDIILQAAREGGEVDLLLSDRQGQKVRRCKLSIDKHPLVPADWDTIRADFYSKPNCFGRRRKGGGVFAKPLDIIEMMQGAKEH